MDTHNNATDKKRRRNPQDSIDFHLLQNMAAEEDDFLALKLASFQNQLTISAPPPPQQQPEAEAPAPVPEAPAPLPAQRRRVRRNPSRAPTPGKSAVIPPPYPWATSARATVRSLEYLRAKGISAIGGDVQCKKCEQRFRIEFDLEQKFGEVARLIAEKKGSMAHRAPRFWLSPALPNCGLCNQEGCVKPVISDKKRSINWLFLLLGQMLGLCTLEQLKYFCKHTDNHRTGAKDRVLFLAYLKLCKQLDPTGPFDI